MQKVFGLIDSDSFYASCETIFNPKLAGKPVVVLSNSDGCVVARNKEAKALQIKMGVPFFEIKHLILKAGLIPCSSNYSLYQDISNRIVQIIARNVPFHEVYSIDKNKLHTVDAQS
ncbi:Y-family DNA polymerase [Pseudomonas lactis]|uniref:Y-family DNA polymerase n=1 Tax=Pseudomonas lactis TaxID=1615674 RepID=UPI003F7FAFA0